MLPWSGRPFGTALADLVPRRADFVAWPSPAATALQTLSALLTADQAPDGEPLPLHELSWS